MNLAAPFPVALSTGQVMLRPLTVRERLMIANNIIERARTKAVADGKACGLSGKDLAASVFECTAEADRVSSVVMSCFTMEGAMSILIMSAGAEIAEQIGSEKEPAELGVIAAMCINVEVQYQKPRGTDTAPK